MSHALSPSLGQLYSVLSLYFEQQKMKILCPFFTFTATQRKGLFDTRIIKLLSLLEQSLLEFASISPNPPPLDFFFLTQCASHVIQAYVHRIYLNWSHPTKKKTELIKIQLLYFMLCHEQWTPLLLTWVLCPLPTFLGLARTTDYLVDRKKIKCFNKDWTNAGKYYSYEIKDPV